MKICQDVICYLKCWKLLLLSGFLKDLIYEIPDPSLFLKRYNKSNQIIIFQDNVESWVMFHCCIMCDDDQN